MKSAPAETDGEDWLTDTAANVNRAGGFSGRNIERPRWRSPGGADRTPWPARPNERGSSAENLRRADRRAPGSPLLQPIAIPSGAGSSRVITE